MYEVIRKSCRIWHWDIFRNDKITLLGIVVDFVFNGVLQWNVRVTQLRITCFVAPTCYYHIITRTFVYFTPLQTLYAFSDCNALNIQFRTCNRDVNIRMQSTVLVIVCILKKIKAYAVRLNKEALKNLPSALLPQRRKQYFMVEYSMVSAVRQHRIDHWRLTEAEKVAILSLSPKKNCPISSYFCIRVPWKCWPTGRIFLQKKKNRTKTPTIPAAREQSFMSSDWDGMTDTSSIQDSLRLTDDRNA